MIRIKVIKFWFLFSLIGLGLLGCAEKEKPFTPAEVDEKTRQTVRQMQIAFQQGDWSRALLLADSVETIVTGLAEIAHTRGLIYTQQKRYDEAQAAFEQALAIEPDYPQAWYNLGHNAFLQREYRWALALYQKERDLLTARERGEEDLSSSLAAITAQIGRTYALINVQDSAQFAYEQSLSLDSTYVVAHSWYSELLENEGQVEKALFHAQKALEGNPQEVAYAYQVGALLFENGRVEESAMLLSAVVNRWPGHEGASYNLGRALIALGRNEEGQELLNRVESIQQIQERAVLAQRAVEVQPEDPQRWLELGGLMLQSGYYDRAEEAFTAALSLNPDNLQLMNDMANLALVRGDTLLAQRRFERLLEQDPTFADAWLNVGILYAMTGRPQEARNAWETVLKYNPGDPDATSYLTQLQQ